MINHSNFRSIKLACATLSMLIVALVGFVPCVASGQSLPTDQILLDPIQGVRAISFSNDGSSVLIGGNGGAKIYNLSTGAETALQPNTAGEFSGTFSPNGQTVVLFGAGPAQIFNVSTGQLITTLSIPNTTIQSAAFSPDGTKIALGGELVNTGGVLEVYSTSSYAVVQSLPTVMIAVTTIAFSPDSTTLADSGSPWGPNEIELWSVGTGQLINTLNTSYSGGNASIAFSPDGSKIATGGGQIPGFLEIWNVSTATLITKFPTAANYEVLSIAFSPDGSTLADCGTALGIGNAQTPVVEMWNIASATLASNVPTQFTGVYSLAFSPNGTTLALTGTGTNYSVELWNKASDSLTGTINVATPFASNAVAYSSDGTQVYAGQGTVIGGVTGFSVGLWNTSTGQLVQSYPSHASYSINSVAVSPNGQILASGGTSKAGTNFSGVLEIWDPAVGGEGFQISTQLDTVVNTVAFSPDGTLFADAGKSSSLGGIVEIWNFALGYRIATLPVAPGGTVNSIAFSPDSKSIAVGGSNTSGGVLALWSVATGSLIQSFPTLASKIVNSVAFSPDGTKLADCGNTSYAFGSTFVTEGLLELWSISTGLYVWTPQTFLPQSANVVAYSSDGSELFVSNGALTAYSAIYGGLILDQQNFGGPGAIAVSPHANQVAISGGSLVLLDNTLADAPQISSFALSPSTVPSGQSSIGTITLASPAPTGGLTILIAEPYTAVTLPRSVTIPAGSTSASFTIVTSSVTATTSYPIVASDSANSVSTTLTVTPPLVTTISVSPTAVVGGTTSTGTVTISAPAVYELGTTVYLSSNNGAANPPTSIQIPSGATSATFTIATSGVSANTTVVITATSNGSSQSANLTVKPASLSSISVAPNGVNGGSSATGTVTLSGPAGVSGSIVSLSSNDPSTTVPSSVTVPSGSTSATFTVSTVGVATTTKVTLSATMGSTTKTALFVVDGVVLHYVVISPSSVIGGAVTTGTVNLVSQAPPNGILVTLSSSGPAATVPSTVMVPGGATSVPFSITTSPVSATVTLNISATLGTVTKSYSLIVAQPFLSGLTLSPSSIAGGATSTGTLTLDGPAPIGGSVVNLSSDNLSAIVPASVTVASGATTATFTIATSPVASPTTANISGSYGYTRTRPLTITSPNFIGFSVSPSSVWGGSASTGTVAISSAAPAGGVTISLSSGSPSAMPPTAVVVPAGATTATFTIPTLPVSAQTSAVLSASFGTTTKSQTLTIYAAKLIGVSMSPSSVYGGAPSVGIVTLNGPAGPGGATVDLTTTNSALSVPATVTVPSGATTASFNATTVGLPSSTGITVNAVLGAYSVSSAFKINGTVLHFITISPNSVVGGVITTGTVNLAGVAPAGGFVVSLSSNNPAASVPTSVTVPAGASTVTFSISTTPVSAVTTLSVTAMNGSVSTSYGLIIAPPVFLGFTVSPGSVVGGATSTGTVVLSGPAPAGGLTVSLSSNNSVASVPATITIPGGSSSASFTVSTIVVNSTVTAAISGTVNGVTKTKALTIT